MKGKNIQENVNEKSFIFVGDENVGKTSIVKLLKN
jgi:GTPase SAR1 family protein